MHNPKKYYLNNGTSQKCLKFFGLKYLSGLTDGEKYEASIKQLKKKIIESNIDNFAILDSCLWGIQNKIQIK